MARVKRIIITISVTFGQRQIVELNAILCVSNRALALALLSFAAVPNQLTWAAEQPLHQPPESTLKWLEVLPPKDEGWGHDEQHQEVVA